MWSKEETEALLAGVKKYGTKRWKRILAKYDDVFQGRRRVVDLVSKHKLINLDSSYYRTNVRDWIMVDKKNNPETDAMGEIISMSAKFPYNAAKSIAKKKIRSGETSFVLRIREGDDLENVHAYLGNKKPNGTLNLKKLALSSEKKGLK